MWHNAYQLIISNFSVGTWLQTVAFYFVLLLLVHIILAQLNLSILKWRLSFLFRWITGRLQEEQD